MAKVAGRRVRGSEGWSRDMRLERKWPACRDLYATGLFVSILSSKEPLEDFKQMRQYNHIIYLIFSMALVAFGRKSRGAEAEMETSVRGPCCHSLRGKICTRAILSASTERTLHLLCLNILL